MKENQISRTAMGTAFMRAYHAKHDYPKIFDDFLAYHFFSDEIRPIIEQKMAESLQLYDPVRAASCPDQATALAWVMRYTASSIFCRARHAEDNLIKAVGQGIRQYVILGAGLDTFAFRRPELLEQLQVFEVDHPAMQAFKRRRLAELGWEHPVQLYFIPVDFTQESLSAALTRSAYDPQVPSFFSWLGVTYYLTRDTVFATLRAVADIAPAGSMIIFDYLDTDAFVPGRMSKGVQVLLERVRQLGEPLITGLNPSTLAADLASLGLHLQENLSPTDIEDRYFQGRTDGYHASKHTHYAWAVVK